MTQFLKNHAKLFYFVFGVFSFGFIVAACFYITQYSDTAVVFNSKFLSGEVSSVSTGNDFLKAFCTRVYRNGKGPAEYNFDNVYQVMFNFNQKLQATNRLLLVFGVVSLIMFACMLICSNHSRKKYYISNLVSGVACPTVSIVLGIVTLVYNFIPLGDLSGKNYEILNWGVIANSKNGTTAFQLYQNGDKSQFSINSTTIIIYGALIIVFLVISALLLAYNVYRYLLTRKELNTIEAQEKVVEQDA